MYVCTYVRMYVCTYVHTYIHTYVRTVRGYLPYVWRARKIFWTCVHKKIRKKRSASKTNVEVNAIICLAELLKSEPLSTTFDYVKVSMFMLLVNDAVRIPEYSLCQVETRIFTLKLEYQAETRISSGNSNIKCIFSKMAIFMNALP